MLISGVIIAKNEEDNIARCIKSLSFCDEIIVIDNNSNDATAAVAEKLKIITYRSGVENDFSKLRNIGLEKAKSDWILFIDADELVSKELASEILKNVVVTGFNGYYFKRYDFIWGKLIKHGEIGSVRLLRLARKNTGIWKRKVHEVWKIEGRIGILKNPIIHYPHPTSNKFIKDLNDRIKVHVGENIEEGKNSSVFKIIFYPPFKFVINYFLNFGFLDGVYGFVIAMLMSFNSFLGWSTLWLKQNR